ncbi:MAG: undecaprenyldiphospho-muramoylpentapeptide beta-N-acetylglucosaminyltransferase [Candidatus Omnitrophota bacterium]|nr:undecaprenyldiphospho-muramoylpentapeptide beta-N-acetylglucosaminyltransferase [Candidatus Omnitrophota bacterium]
MKVLVACGGSGGHIFPAIALTQGLKERDKTIELLFVGSNNVLDKRIFEKEHLHYSLLSSNKLPYKASMKTIIFFVKLFFDIIKSFFIVIKHSPDAVIGFGGYVSSPVIFAAYILRVPTVIHEQNVVPGRSNSVLFRFADRIAVSFEETKKYLGRFSTKAVFTGNPIRANLFKDDKAESIKKFGLDAAKFTILIIGGSQGAHSLNKNFLQAMAKLDTQKSSLLQIIHITGITDYEWVSRAYEEIGIEHRVFSFIDNIEQAYSVSDLVVTRSGASAIFEIAYFGRPMILVPYPFAMSHQAENAKVFSRNGAAIQIDEKEMSPDIVKNRVESLLDNRAVLDQMAKRAKDLSVPDSSYNLAGEVLKIVKG